MGGTDNGNSAPFDRRYSVLEVLNQSVTIRSNSNGHRSFGNTRMWSRSLRASRDGSFVVGMRLLPAAFTIKPHRKMHRGTIKWRAANTDCRGRAEVNRYVQSRPALKALGKLEASTTTAISPSEPILSNVAPSSSQYLQRSMGVKKLLCL